MSDPQRFPLTWPAGWARTRPEARRRASFGKRVSRTASGYRSLEPLEVGDGLSRLMGELSRLGARGVVVSTNLAYRADGMPYARQSKVLDDPGVAVYFQLKGRPHALACDRWTSVADNMAAIAGHVEALRAVDRYGVGSLEQAFAGYRALPAQASAWWTVLGFDERPTDLATVERRHQVLTRQHHPDLGGSSTTMAKINAARDAARLDILGGPHPGLQRDHVG